MRRLHTLVQGIEASLLLALAHHMLGTIHAGRAQEERAIGHFHASLASTAHLMSNHLIQGLDYNIDEIYTQEVITACALSILYVRQKAYDKAANAHDKAWASMQHMPHTKIKVLFPRQRWPQDWHTQETCKKIESSMLFAGAQIYGQLGHVFELGYLKSDTSLSNTAITLALAAWRLTYHSNILDFLLPLVHTYGLTAQLLPEFMRARAQKKVSKVQEKRLMELAHEVYYDIMGKAD